MKKITVDGSEYNVPQNWSDITLKHYETFYDLRRETKIDEVLLVASISTIPYRLLSDLPLSFYNEILNTILFVFDNIQYKALSYIKDSEDNTYYVNTSQELTLGQWVDIELINENTDSKTKLSDILAIVCLKKNEKYLPELSETRKELFGSLSMDKIFPILTFFLKLNERLKRITELYLKIQKQIDQYQENTEVLQSVGVGKR
ncbi:hypothetical protein EZS27_004661 [termite gut metagenome]|uniref:Uncharacterized protein n=1 Tax=termite gut metagenome TaxID=433724 RepID=A0A5J4SR50_9ZZZZ